MEHAVMAMFATMQPSALHLGTSGNDTGGEGGGLCGVRDEVIQPSVWVELR